MFQSPEDGYALVLSGGFIAAAVGVLLAHDTPGVGYEPSIYAATPVSTWVLFGLALLVATLGGLFWRSDIHRYLAISLGATTMTAIVMVPIIRGYRFLGHADPMTHLGWARDITLGALDPVSLFYPGLHVSSIGLSSLMGVSLERAMLTVVVVLFVSYLVFVPLAIKALTDDTGMVVLGAISSWLVLPMNQIATVLLPHTNSLTLLLIPGIIYAMIVYLRRTESEPLIAGYGTGIGVVLAVLGAGLLLFHPQHALNVILVFLGVSAVQFVFRRRRVPHPITEHRPFYTQTVIAIALFATWVSTHSLFSRAIESTLEGLFTGDVGATSTVAQRGTSLADIGASLPEVFAKLFLVSAIFGLVTVWFVLSVWRGRFRIDPQVSSFVTYIAVGFVPLAGIFAFYFIGTPKMSFRQLGMLFVLITIVGAIALGYAGRVVNRRFTRISTGAIKTVVAVFFLGGLLLAVLTIFPSPFIYSASPQVTDQHLNGYEIAFEHRAGEIPYAAMGSRVDRYGDGLQGTRSNAGFDFYGPGDGFVDAEAFSSRTLTAGYPASPYYLAVTAYDIERQVEVYNQLHYTSEGVAGLDTQPRVDRIQSNGEFELYLVG